MFERPTVRVTDKFMTGLIVGLSIMTIVVALVSILSGCGFVAREAASVVGQEIGHAGE